MVALRQPPRDAIINRGPTERDGLKEVTLRLEGDVEEIFAPAVTEALAAV